jgi:hypothetical protein
MSRMMNQETFYDASREAPMKKRFIAISVLCCLVSVPALAQKFGDFSALKLDEQVVEDILTQGNDIYVKIKKPYWGAAFEVKISNHNMADYRKWSNGDEELAVKVYQSQKENRQGYTYRVSTTAKYVEFWMEGRLILQLERTS